MDKKFNIHDWQSKHLFEQEEFTPDLEDDDLKRSKIQQRKHAKEFRDFLDSEDELDEASVTGTGASFSAGAGEGYATPNAFANDDDWKNKNTKYE